MLEDEPQAVLERLNLADAQWGKWCYAVALRTYRKADAAAADACSTEGREFCLLGRGIVLWSIGQYVGAARALRDGLGVARDLGDLWGTAYGLTYLSAVHAAVGELSTATRISQEAADVADSLGAGYPLSLARVYHLWQREVQSPGDPAHEPLIEEALQQARRFGLEGLALHLSWVQLLRDVADPSCPDERLLTRLLSDVKTFPIGRPSRGAWEVLGLQVVQAIGQYRPTLDLAAVRALEALIDCVIEQKAQSLASMPGLQLLYRATRRCWGAA